VKRLLGFSQEGGGGGGGGGMFVHDACNSKSRAAKLGVKLVMEQKSSCKQFSISLITVCIISSKSQTTEELKTLFRAQRQR
jgi:hypothetical protein